MALTIKVSGNLVQVYDNGQLVGSRRIEPNASRSLPSSGLLRVNNVTYTPEDILKVPVTSSISGQSTAGLTTPGGASSLEVSTARRASDPGPSAEVFGPPASLAVPPATTPTTVGEVPPLNPDDFYWKWDEVVGEMVPSRKGEPGAVFSNVWWAEANEARQNIGTGFPGGGTGPTAAELAIQRSQVQATNLATFISGTIAELDAEIDAGRLETEQAIGEFNRRLDAFAEAGEQFREIQPFTIPIGAEFAPGFGPGEIGEQLGIKPRRAEVIQFDPFAMATDIVNQTPVLTDIGVPSGDELAEAVRLARGFL